MAATSGARHLYTSSTDERGRFELVIAADETEVSIRVGATVVENVAPGVRDLDIRLR